jgi:hypothetical protein
MSTLTLEERVGTDKLVQGERTAARGGASAAAWPSWMLLGRDAAIVRSWSCGKGWDIEQAILSQHLTLMRDKGLVDLRRRASTASTTCSGRSS